MKKPDFLTRWIGRHAHSLTLQIMFACIGVVALSASILIHSLKPDTTTPTLTPGEDDLFVVNGCVVSACNYLAIVQAKNKLETNFWSRVLLVRYSNHRGGHAYCVWETDGSIYGYSRSSGTFPLPIYTRDPEIIAMVLAREISPVEGEHLSVSNAEFIEPANVEIAMF